jgi:hypothetical protein
MEQVPLPQVAKLTIGTTTMQGSLGLRILDGFVPEHGSLA